MVERPVPVISTSASSPLFRPARNARQMPVCDRSTADCVRFGPRPIEPLRHSTRMSERSGWRIDERRLGIRLRGGVEAFMVLLLCCEWSGRDRSRRLLDVSPGLFYANRVVREKARAKARGWVTRLKPTTEAARAVWR